MRRVWGLAALGAILLVGCRAETNVIVDIGEDGSGTYTVELGLDEELQQLLGAFTGGEGDGLIPGFDLDIPGLEGNPLESLQSRVEGDMTYYANTEQFADPAELEQLIAAAGEENNFETFRLSIDGDLVTLEAKAGAPGQLIEGAGDLPLSLDVIEQAFKASVIVGMPGTVKERNADEVLPDGRLRWEISLSEGVDILAVSDLSEPGFPWWLVGVVVAAAILLAFGLWASRRSSTRPTQALAATETPPPPAGFDEARTRDISDSRAGPGPE
ncbi:MAG: hypothetical protein ACE5GC_08810 [Acidimicrobiia bacterium]